MEDELILSDKDRSKLDGIVNQMIENNEPDDNIQFVVNDFKGKYGVKKKESSEVSASQPSARPSASATSPRVPQPAQAREPIQPTFRTQAPDIFGAGRPVAQPKPTEQPKDQLSPAAKAQVQARVAKGEVAEAPAKKPEVKEAPAPESSSYLQAVEKDEFERANRVRSAVGEAESKLNEKNVDKSLSQSFDLGWGPNVAVKTEDSEDVQDARKKANTEIRDVFNVDFDVYVPNEQGVLVEDTEKIAVVKDYLQKSNQYEQYVKAQNTVDEAKRRLQEDPNAFPLTSQLLNTVPESIGLATALAFDAAGAGDTRAYSDEVRAKRTARRIALGLDENKGIVDNISEGNIGDAMKELMLAGADFVPQMAAFVINPAVGYAYNAASAGGSTYDQFRDRNDLSKGDKMALALTSAAADLVLNKLTMGAEKSIRASLGITAEELGTETAKKKALDYLNPLKNEVIGKGFFGEAAEEGGVNIINQIAASIIAGDEFDVNSLIDETLIGGVFGSTAVGLPKVLARGANGLANASMVSEFRKVTDQIKEINDALLNEELTPSQSELLTRQLEQLSLRQTEISNASEQIYSAMTKEDQEALYEAHKQINEGLKTYNEAENKVVKNAAFSQVRQALLAKRDLENKYAGQVKTERDDRQEEVGVPSPVVEGEAVVETEPIEGAGQEAPEASGVLQVPIEEGAEVAPQIEATVFAAPFYDTKVNNIEEARTIRQSEPYVKNLDSIRQSSSLFNVEVDEVDESIGGFINEAGDKIVEVSNIVRVKGTPEDIENYAAFLATSAPETQEATIAATYVEPDSETHNIDELTISVSDIDGAIESLKENDIYDFTINDSKQTITFLDFSKGGDEAFMEKIGNFANSLEKRNINYERKDIRAIDSNYISPRKRAGILSRLQESLVQQGQTGTELYRQVEQAIAKNEEFLRKTQASETEAEVAPEAQATEQDAASLEGVTIRAIKPEQGKTLEDIRKSYEKSIKPSITPKTVLENVKKELIDRQSKIKKAVLDIGLRNAYDRIVNKAGTSARANDKYLRAEKKIYKGLSEDEIKLLDDIIFARRVIQIDKNFDARKQKRPKHPLGYTSENAVFELDSFKEKFGEQKYNDLIRRSDLYFDEFRSILKDLYDSGLITKETYENLRTNNYQPRKFIEHVYDFKNSKFLLKDNGLTDKQIRAIEEGSEKDLIMNSRFLLASYLLSSSNRILSNRTNQALSKAIGKKEGTSEWIRPLKDGDDADKGFSKVSYLEKGELKRFQLRSDLKEELDNVSTSIGDNGRFLSIALGVPLIKLMATGANPIFAAKNVPRDFGHVIFFTNIYDKHNIYYATYLLFKDYRKGLKSAMQDDQDFKDYMDLGGGMSFLASAGRDGKLSNKTFKDKVLNFLGKPGELSEISMRIAVYKRFKEEGINAFEKKNNTKPTGEDLLEIKESSVAKAREIIDFQQGGNLVKSMDKFVPYLNAAFQGFRVGSTYIANNPKAFGRKFVEAQIGLLALSFLNSLASDDEDMQNIPEHTRLMNFIIFIPFTNRKDEDGVERKAFIKIPKTQQAAPFFALMDVANRKIINDVFGKEYDVSEDEYNFIMSGLKKSLPIGLSSALGVTDVLVRKAVGGAKDEKIENEAFRDLMQTVPLLNAVGTYMSNYDAFRDRMITMEKEEVLPSFEGVSDPSVEKFYKVIGETTGMSPIRTKAATEKLITSPQSSLVIGMAYGLLDAMAEKYDLDKGDYNIETLKSDDKNALKNIGLNVKKAFINETDPKWKLYSQKETLDNIDKEAGTERARLRAKAKELAMGTNNQEQLDKSIAEAQKIALEIADKNPVDAKYFIESFKSNIGESPASQQSVEIQYSASDKARAEKIKLLYNPQTKDDFMRIMRDVYQQTGYKISPKTIYEYQQAYGELK
jgi:hypothetical protein